MPRIIVCSVVVSLLFAQSAAADVLPSPPKQRPTRIEQRVNDGRLPPPIHSKRPPHRLILRASEIQQQGASVFFRPDRHVRRATYLTYRIPRARFFRVFPTLAAADRQTLRCWVWRISRKQHNVPAGTITTLTYDCGSIQLVSPTVRVSGRTTHEPRPILDLRDRAVQIDTRRKHLPPQAQPHDLSPAPLDNRPPSANRDGRNVPFELPLDQFRIVRPASRGSFATFTTYRRGKLLPRKNGLYERFEITPSSRKAAVYVRLLIPKTQLDRILKERRFSKLTLFVQIENVRTSRYTPPPYMSSPAGGFLYHDVFANLRGLGIVP
ncbi:hypothetical protein L6R29_08350 [Myxococcota bacterium]|nr:hypothetical protein [Myxococcota bacterium]